MKIPKKTWIILGVVIAVILSVVWLFAGTNNRAITLEEQLNTATAEINVAEKRRVDLVYNLADAVLSYQNYERGTYEMVTAARASAQSGRVEDAEMVLAAVAEQYCSITCANAKDKSNQGHIRRNIACIFPR